MESVSALFPLVPPTVVSDSVLVCQLFEQRGFRSIVLSKLICAQDEAPKSIILITCDPLAIPSRGTLGRIFKASSVLIVPLLSFSADDASIRYLADTILKVDFRSACAANLKLVEWLESNYNPIVVNTHMNQLVVDLSLSLEVALPKVQAEIASGEWVSLGQFLEIGLVPNEGHTAFLVNGAMLCDGIAVAHHRHYLEDARPKAFKAWKIVSDMRNRGDFPLRIEVCASRVTCIATRTGEDVLQQFLPLTDEVFRGMLTEVAFASTNAFSDVDWGINSQLNEGAGGSHIALGTGVHGAHIDFIASNAEVEFETS